MTEDLTKLKTQVQENNNRTRYLVTTLHNAAETLHRCLVVFDDWLCEWRGLSRKPRGKYVNTVDKR